MKKKLLVKPLVIFIILILQYGKIWANNLDSLLALLPHVNDTQKVLLQINIGKAYSKNREFEKAIKYYDASLDESKKIKFKVGEALANQYTAKLYSRRSVYDTAAVFYKTALLLFDKINRPNLKVDCLNDYAVLFYYKGEYSEAIQQCFKALTLSDKVTDKSCIARIYNNLGNCYYFQKNFEQALNYYQKSYKIEAQGPNKSSIAGSLGNIGLIYFEMKDYQASLKNHLLSYQLQKEINDTNEMAASLINIGLVYEKTNQLQKALEITEESLLLRRLINDERRLAFSIIKVASIQTKLKNLSQAEILYKEAIAMAKKNESFHYLMEAYEGLSDVFERKGDFKNALEMHHQYALIKDSIYSETSAQEIAEAQEKYESEKKQRALELLQKNQEINQIKLEKNKNYLYFTICIILAIIIILGALYQQFRIKKRSNFLLEEQNNLISAQKKEITDSINYASIIQRAMLPLPSEFNAHFPKNFIFYQPKDIVSGDFYWCGERNGMKAIVVADCTGHGVPGAMMSMVGNNLLNQAFNDLKLNKPSQILEFLDKGVSKTLHQQANFDSAKNSMDLCFCLIDESNQQLIYGGSMNSIYLITQNELSVLKTDKVPIGYHFNSTPKVFNSYTQNYKKGDKIYLASDGIQDQFGGPNGKKLMTKKLKEFILNINNFPMEEQYHHLDKLIEDWKGKYEQTDDMLLIGIEL